MLEFLSTLTTGLLVAAVAWHVAAALGIVGRAEVEERAAYR